MYGTLRNKFETWTQVECMNIDRQEVKIREIGHFRDTLEEEFANLRGTQLEVDELNGLLLAQNLKSAIGLYEARIKKLRERALDVKDLFSKIKKAGKDMDGNHTDDEIDFVEALAEEMPTVDQEMSLCIAKIDVCDKLLLQLKSD